MMKDKLRNDFCDKISDIWLGKCDGAIMGNIESVVEEIYRQGRADQNEADAKIIIGLPFELIGGAGADAKLDILARIRAAGPEVGE